MSDVRSCKGKAVRTESKDLAAPPPLNPLNLLNSPNLFRMQSKGGTPHGLTLPPFLKGTMYV